MAHQIVRPNGTRLRQRRLADPSQPAMSSSRPSRFAARFLAVVLIGCLFAGINVAFSQSSAIGKAPQQHRPKRQDVHLFANSTPPLCRDVRLSQDQCRFVKEYCHDEDEGLISYLQLYYCSLADLPGLAWIIILLWTALLFVSIGICAESFFSVNLSFIAKALHLSDTLAGVTLLALGNGGPDLFSTWAAMASGSPELAIGELVGSASFISTVIAGSIALLGSFHIYKVSFVRDAFFLLVTSAFLLPILVTGQIHLWQGLAMIALYIVYVGCVAGYHWWARTPSPTAAANHEPTSENETTPLLSNHSRRHDEHRAAYHDHQKTLRDGTAVYKEMTGWRRRHGLEIQAKDDYFIQPSILGSLEYRHRHRVERRHILPCSNDRRANECGADHDTRRRHRKVASSARHVYETLLPTLRDLGQRRSWHTWVNLCTTLPYFLMKITIPVKDSDQDDCPKSHGTKSFGWDRWLLILQGFVAPQFIWALLWPSLADSMELRSWLEPALFCVAGSVIFAFIILASTVSGGPPRWSPLVAILGFGISAYWLCTIANEVVAILKTIGAILDVSEGILGFTLFAIGNSIDDYVADMTVSQHGHQVMALSACFGGPLLNILLGLGTSIVYVISRNVEVNGKLKSIRLDVDLTLLASTAVLAATMAALIAVLWFSKWKMTRVIGIGLIVIWVALATANVLIETLLE